MQKLLIQLHIMAMGHANCCAWFMYLAQDRKVYSLSPLQVRVLLKECMINVNTEGGLLGNTLESALEHGEKFDDTVTKIKSVCHSIEYGIALAGMQ